MTGLCHIINQRWFNHSGPSDTGTAVAIINPSKINPDHSRGAVIITTMYFLWFIMLYDFLMSPQGFN